MATTSGRRYIGILTGIFLFLTACGSVTGQSATNTAMVNQILANARSASPSAASYTVDIVSTSGSTPEFVHEQVSYIKQPLAMDIAITTNTHTNASTIETLISGGVSYEKLDGVWHKVPAKQVPALSTLDVGHLILGEVTTATLIGTEHVNGIAAYHLHAIFVDSVSGSTQDADLWIRTDNAYFLREEAQVTGHDAQGNIVKGTISYLYTAWDNNVKITPPQV